MNFTGFVVLGCSAYGAIFCISEIHKKTKSKLSQKFLHDFLHCESQLVKVIRAGLEPAPSGFRSTALPIELLGQQALKASFTTVLEGNGWKSR